MPRSPCLRWALGIILGLLAMKYLLPLVLPLALGLAAAAVMNPGIVRLQRRFRLGRGAASGLCVTGLLLLLGLLLYLLGRLLVLELGRLYRSLPALLLSLSESLSAFGQWADGLSRQLPGSVGDAFSSWAQEIVGSGGTIAQSLYEKLFALVSGFLSALPDNLLFLLTAVLSCYFSAGELPRLQSLIRERLPQPRWERLRRLGRGLRGVLGAWVRAQLLLMGVTFLILLTGFLLLGVKLPLVLALGIAALDALPLFGTGTILLPWGLVRLMAGDFHLGLGLMVLYAAAALCRNALEPRFLGAQVGVSPLLTLLAIYAGYQLSGVTGMLLLPIGVMAASALVEASRTPEASAEPVQRQGIFSPRPEP